MGHDTWKEVFIPSPHVLPHKANSTHGTENTEAVLYRSVGTKMSTKNDSVPFAISLKESTFAPDSCSGRAHGGSTNAVTYSIRFH